MSVWAKLVLEIRDHSLIRRVLVIGNFALVWVWIMWSFELAKLSKFDGMGTAGVIAAIGAPLTALTGYIFSAYNDSRNKDKAS
jgi:hypothetical protein